jgi:hypothetical protein
MDKTAKTAIVRKKLSVPFKWLLDNGYIKGRTLDYGCGRGFDADFLGIDKYDPNYFPQLPRGKYRTIYCGYVLNVVEPAEQVRIREKIRGLLKWYGVCYFVVRRDIPLEGTPTQWYVTMDLESICRKGHFEIYRMRK